MEIDITTPALLFPAISLLLLAYTNRFLTTGQLIRQLKGSVIDGDYSTIQDQIGNLSQRVKLIILMQVFGVASILMCTISMISFFYQMQSLGNKSFLFSLLLMVLSLLISLWEIVISGKALGFELQHMGKDVSKSKRN